MEGSPEEQVKQLNEEYTRKLAEIQAQTPEAVEPQAEADRILGEHQAVSETTEDMIKKQIPDFKASSHERGHSVDGLSEENHTKVQELVNVGIQNPYKSIEMAKNLKDDSLVDALHGALSSNAIFAEMVKRGVLPQLGA